MAQYSTRRFHSHSTHCAYIRNAFSEMTARRIVCRVFGLVNLSYALSFAVVEQRSKTSGLLENGLRPYGRMDGCSDGRTDGQTDSDMCRDEKKNL